MPDVDREEAVRYIIDGLDPKPFRAIWDRIAQIIVAPVVQVRFAVVEHLSDTLRGVGGFGSTGRR